jgi:hypothetical protein
LTVGSALEYTLRFPEREAISMTPAATQIRPKPDLPLLACEAAVELDNLILSQSTGLEAVRCLASAISDAVDVPEPAKPSSLLDAATAVALHRAMGNVATLDELLQRTKAMTARLLAATPEQLAGREEEWKLLRSFCLALSQHAAALRQTPEDTSRHPLRRLR